MEVGIPIVHFTTEKHVLWISVSGLLSDVTRRMDLSAYLINFRTSITTRTFLILPWPYESILQIADTMTHNFPPSCVAIPSLPLGRKITQLNFHEVNKNHKFGSNLQIDKYLLWFRIWKKEKLPKWIWKKQQPAININMEFTELRENFRKYTVSLIFGKKYMC